MNLTHKILAKAAGLSTLQAGQHLELPLSLAMGNDITAYLTINALNKHYTNYQVFDKDKVVVVLDHFTPNCNIAAAEQCKAVREWSKKMEITHLYDGAEVGVEHALLPEQGLLKPCDIVIGADSHTCTYGALGLFSTGVGSTDLAYGIISGKTWLRVPEVINVKLHGLPKTGVTGKDIILSLIGILGVDGARYMSLEFTGEGVSALTMDSRFTMCNMAIECGAKNAVFPVDEVTKQYLKEVKAAPYTILQADEDADYCRTIDMDLSKIDYTVACPSSPANAKPARELNYVKLNQVYIGSCTNGRYSDLVAAADYLKGKKVAKGVRLIVVPATPTIYKQALKNGIFETLLDAGAVISPPTCGACLGGHMGILASDEVCISTTNRNFTGRMGAETSKVYLASPLIAAVSAVKGYIDVPD